MGSWGVPTPVSTSSGYLITIDDVKQHLGITDTTDDDLLAELMEMASDSLNRAYGPLPTCPKTTEARYYFCHNKLVLLDECVSVTSVTDSSGRALSGYTLLYGRRTSDFLKGIILNDSTDERITVTGTWGYDSAPADVGRALLVTVGTFYKRAKLGSDMDVIGSLSGLPKEARDLMDARRTAEF